MKDLLEKGNSWRRFIGALAKMELWSYGLRRARAEPHDLYEFVEELGFKIAPILEPDQSIRPFLSSESYCNVIITRP